MLTAVALLQVILMDHVDWLDQPDIDTLAAALKAHVRVSPRPPLLPSLPAPKRACLFLRAPALLAPLLVSSLARAACSPLTGPAWLCSRGAASSGGAPPSSPTMRGPSRQQDLRVSRHFATACCACPCAAAAPWLP